KHLAFALPCRRFPVSRSADYSLAVGREASLLGHASRCAFLRPSTSLRTTDALGRSRPPPRRKHLAFALPRRRFPVSLRSTSLAYFALDRRSTSTSCRVSLSRHPWRSAGLARSCARRSIDGSSMKGFDASAARPRSKDGPLG